MAYNSRSRPALMALLYASDGYCVRDDRGRTTGIIAEKLGSSRTSVSALLGKLEAEGLVWREAGHGGKSTRAAGLTQLGIELFTKAKRDPEPEAGQPQPVEPAVTEPAIAVPVESGNDAQAQATADEADDPVSDAMEQVNLSIRDAMRAVMSEHEARSQAEVNKLEVDISGLRDELASALEQIGNLQDGGAVLNLEAVRERDKAIVELEQKVEDQTRRIVELETELSYAQSQPSKSPSDPTEHPKAVAKREAEAAQKVTELAHTIAVRDEEIRSLKQRLADASRRPANNLSGRVSDLEQRLGEERRKTTRLEHAFAEAKSAEETERNRANMMRDELNRLRSQTRAS
jgi:DNA-binding MarR family transcriptional regulator